MAGKKNKKTSFNLLFRSGREFPPPETRGEKPKMSLTGFTLIEVLIVAGIVSLVMGAAFVFLTMATKSADVNEAQIQTKEYAQQAMDRITREVRFSRPERVRITNTIGWTQEISPGSVINFQIPVGIYNTTLDLNEDYTVKWGSEANEGYYLAYSIDGNSQLLRSTYATANGSGLISQIVTPRIFSLTFSRASANADLINIEIVAEVQIPSGSAARRIIQTLRSDVKLRNF